MRPNRNIQPLSRRPARVILFSVSAEQIKERPDIWIENLPGWVSTHTMADRGWSLHIRQAIQQKTEIGHIRAIFTPNICRETGFKVVIRSQAPLESWQAFWKYLDSVEYDRWKTWRSDFTFKPTSADPYSIDDILDRYGIEQILKRNNARMLERLQERQRKEPPSAPAQIQLKKAV